MRFKVGQKVISSYGEEGIVRASYRNWYLVSWSGSKGSFFISFPQSELVPADSPLAEKIRWLASKREEIEKQSNEEYKQLGEEIKQFHKNR